MMKRKFLAVVLPIIGCATVVGSGFSAWYFGQGVIASPNSISANVNVTEEVGTNTNNLKITDDSTINDQSAVVLDQGGFNNKMTDSGIMFGTSNDTETTATTDKAWKFNVTFDGDLNDTPEESDLSIDEIYKAGMRIRISTSIEIQGPLMKYISFKGNQKFTVKPTIDGCKKEIALSVSQTNINMLTADYIVEQSEIGTSTDFSATWTFELDLNTTKTEAGNYSNALLIYKDHATDSDDNYIGGKPIASGEPLKMYNDINNVNVEGEVVGSKVVFSVSAFIEDDPNK